MMKKNILILAILSLLAACSDPVIPHPSRMDNIDSLVAAIKKDSVFHIKSVQYNVKDSSLSITITDKEYSTDYFNNTYHLNDFKSIDGVTLYDSHHKKLSSDSRRGARIASIFKDQYCVGQICLPLRDRIKSQMNDPESFESAQLWVEWCGDSLVTVTNSFRGKNAFGALILNKVAATMDLSGKIINMENQQ